MKKLLTKFLSVTLVFALICGFAACNFGIGTTSQTSGQTSAEQSADPEREAAIATLTEYLGILSACNVEENEYDVYTKDSVAALIEALPSETVFEVNENVTTEQITAFNETLAALIGNLVLVDDEIDARLQLALDSQLNLRRYYKEDESEATYDNFDYYGLVEEVGVDIEYVKSTNTANFLIPTDTLGESLRTFINSGVLNLFTSSFSDVYAVEFTVTVATDDSGILSEQKITVSGLSGTDGGMILAAGLLAITMGYEQQVYEAYITGNTEVLFNALRGLMGSGEDQATYESIVGKGCTADVVFKNNNYYFASTFAINFTGANFSSDNYFTAPGVLA